MLRILQSDRKRPANVKHKKPLRNSDFRFLSQFDEKSHAEHLSCKTLCLHSLSHFLASIQASGHHNLVLTLTLHLETMTHYSRYLSVLQSRRGHRISDYETMAALGNTEFGSEGLRAHIQKSVNM